MFGKKHHKIFNSSLTLFFLLSWPSFFVFHVQCTLSLKISQESEQWNVCKGYTELEIKKCQQPITLRCQEVKIHGNGIVEIVCMLFFCSIAIRSFWIFAKFGLLEGTVWYLKDRMAHTTSRILFSSNITRKRK